jgi:hypothetical protein
MSDRLVQLLKSLRDVEGVVGSFLWGKSGTVLGRDLPGFVDEAALDEIGPRIERIYEAFRGAGDELDGATLVFAEHKLHLRELEPAFIAVLSLPRVNAPALKMALHLVGRNVCAELERAQSVAPAATVAAPPAAASAPATAATVPPSLQPPAEPPVNPAPRPSRMRFWRGSRIPD